MKVKTVKLKSLNIGDTFIIPHRKDTKNAKCPLFIKVENELKGSDSIPARTWLIKVGHTDRPVNKFSVSSDKDVIPVIFS